MGTPRQGLGRSKGGFTTKIHLRINAMGLPIAVALTGGEVSDFKGYRPVMDADGPAPQVLLSAKGYDADFIRQDMATRGGVAMIPTKRHRIVHQPLDATITADMHRDRKKAGRQ